MSASADHIISVFGKKDLYDILEVPKTATPGEIKKAYFKLALKCHPDKCPGDEAAHGRFQALSMVHSILSDQDSRQAYDETGDIQQEDADSNDADFDMWYDYFRGMFPKVTLNDIQVFQDKYKGSEEETGDILNAYKQHKGNLRKVIDTVMLANEDDEERFREVVQAAIDNGTVQAYPAFTAKAAGGKAKRKKKASKEAEEAEASLADLIRVRQQDRQGLAKVREGQFTDMLAGLEAKYGAAPKKAKAAQARGSKKAKAVEPPDIDETEFQAVQQRMAARSKRKGT